MARESGAKKNWSAYIAWSVVAIMAGAYGWRAYMDSYTRPRLKEANGQLTISMPNDGPLVVTHVVSRGESGREKRVALLRPPIAIIDSEGATIDLLKLEWYDVEGTRSDRPTDGKLEILYCVPKQTVQE